MSGQASVGLREVRERLSFRRWAATSKASLPRFLRAARRSYYTFSLPAPKLLVIPALWVFIAIRKCFLLLWRVFVCEPLFKAHCTHYGRNLHTESKIHWIMGKGDIVVGDDVVFGGKVDIVFAARFSNRPRLEVGDKTEIGHGCRFAIGKLISIGSKCTLSGDITIMDTNAHVSDPQGRLEKRPPSAEEIRPVRIADNVWIARQCIIFPGVRIGEGSIVSAGSVVRTHIPPYAVVAGNPAKVMFRLQRPVEERKSE